MKNLWIGLLMSLAVFLTAGGSPFLGVTLVDPTEEQIKSYDTKGVLINTIIPNTPAEQAKMEKGWMIVKIAGVPVETTDELRAELQRHNVGDTIKIVTVPRKGEGKPVTHSVVLVDRNKTVPYSYSFYSPEDNPVGMTLTTVTPQLREFFGVPYGVMISEIEMKSSADSAGLKAGDVVMRVDGAIVDSPEDVRGELNKVESCRTVAIDVNRKGERKTYELRVDCRKITLAVPMPESVMREYLYDPSIGQLEIPDLDHFEKVIEIYAQKAKEQGKKTDLEELRKRFAQLEKELAKLQKQLEEK
jgi:serine protease Do